MKTAFTMNDLKALPESCIEHMTVQSNRTANLIHLDCTISKTCEKYLNKECPLSSEYEFPTSPSKVTEENVIDWIRDNQEEFKKAIVCHAQKQPGNENIPIKELEDFAPIVLRDALYPAYYSLKHDLLADAVNAYLMEVKK